MWGSETAGRGGALRRLLRPNSVSAIVFHRSVLLAPASQLEPINTQKAAIHESTIESRMNMV